MGWEAGFKGRCISIWKKMGNMRKQIKERKQKEQKPRSRAKNKEEVMKKSQKEISWYYGWGEEDKFENNGRQKGNRRRMGKVSQGRCWGEVAKGRTIAMTSSQDGRRKIRGSVKDEGKQQCKPFDVLLQSQKSCLLFRVAQAFDLTDIFCWGWAMFWGRSRQAP